MFGYIPVKIFISLASKTPFTSQSKPTQYNQELTLNKARLCQPVVVKVFTRCGFITFTSRRSFTVLL